MKVLVLLLLVAIALVESRVVRRDVDPDGFDDEADSQEVTFEDGDYFEDEDGNLVAINDEEDDETLEETEALISERVFFHLYTWKNPTSSQELIIDDPTTLANSNWDSGKLTRIVTHGWINSHNSESCTLVRDAYLENGDYNIIVVDWSKISKRSYGFAARRVRTVGSYIGKMIDFLESQGMDLSQTVVVGHSLGGHIAGISSRMATNTVGYVVGLDPAGPYFWFSGPGNRIAQGDAAYVQVIHTNAGKLGHRGAIGDIDFYPNGGSSQNGCTLDVAGTCAHSRAYKYFAESINTADGFWGQECRTWRRWRYGRCGSTTTAYMGGNVPTQETQDGSYFFRTASSSNFALGPL